MLSGGNGNDLLIGGGDHDVLIGGPGLDKFQCNGESDLILDFNPKEDIASGSCIFPTST
jgi:Ca2+-binding RTX toxin-like protein